MLVVVLEASWTTAFLLLLCDNLMGRREDFCAEHRLCHIASTAEISLVALLVDGDELRVTSCYAKLI